MLAAWTPPSSGGGRLDGSPGLARALLDKHAREIDARRHALLDAYEAQAEPDLRGLAAALVQPLAAKLEDPDGGRGYLRIIAQLVPRPGARFEPSGEDEHNSLVRWRALMASHLDKDAVRVRRRLVAMRFAILELAR